MRKRGFIVGGAVILVIMAIGAVVCINAQKSDKNKPTPQYWAQAVKTSADVTCLKANPNVNISQSTRNGIELSAMSYLIDVPAGTNVDIKLASYSPGRATGTDYYPAKYGSYNFVLAKQSDGWHVTSFNRCR